MSSVGHQDYEDELQEFRIKKHEPTIEMNNETDEISFQ